MKRQLLPFVLVGASAAAVHLAVVAAAVQLAGITPLPANVVGFLVAFLVSFGGHVRWTFPTPPSERAGARRRFFAIALTGFALNQAAYAWALRLVGERWYLPALFGVLLAVAVSTFLLSKLWAFAPAPH